MSPTIAATTTRNDSVSVTLSYLNNGSIFELDQVRFKQNLTHQQSLDIVSHVSCENSKNFDLQQFKCELKNQKIVKNGVLRIEKAKRDELKYLIF